MTSTRRPFSVSNPPSIFFSVLCGLVLSTLTGCTGVGHGASYRPPVVGLDGQAQYEADLAECQDRVKHLDGASVTGVQGATIGGLAGAAISTPGATVGLGMLLGGLRAATSTEADIRQRIRACLTWKGHQMTISEGILVPTTQT